MVYSRRHPSAALPAVVPFPNAAAFIILLLLFPQVASFDAAALWSEVAPDVSWRFQVQAVDDDHAIAPGLASYPLFEVVSTGDNGLREQIRERIGSPFVVLGLAAVLWLAYLGGLFGALARLRIGLLLFGLALPTVVLSMSAAVAFAENGLSPMALVQMLFLSVLYAVTPEALAPDIAASLGLSQELVVLLPRLAALASFLWVTVALKFYSRAVVGFVVVVLLVAVSLRLGAAHSPLWPWLLNLFAAVGFILALRLLWLIVAQNLPLFGRLGIFGTVWGVIRSAVLWTPMLLLLGPFVIIDKTVRENIKANLADSIESSQQGTAVLGNATVPVTIQTQTQRLIALQAVLQIREIQAQVQQVRMAMDDMLKADLRREVEAIARGSIRPRIGFASPNNSGFFGPLKNAAESLAQDTSNKAYATMRQEMIGVLGDLAAEVQGSAQDKREAVEARLAEAESTAIGKVIAGNREAQSSMAYAFLYLDIAHRAGIVLFLLICIKSFANVFSRVALHHRKGGGWVSIGEEGAPAHTTVALREVGDVYTLQAGKRPSRMYMSRRFAATGCAPRFVIPQPAGAPFGRLWSGTLAMNRVDLEPEQTQVRYTATRGARFVEWTLGADESVMVDLRYFVGMESTVRVSTLLSARFGTLLLGGFAFPVFTGPGRIVLLADGRVESIAPSAEHASLPPERIIAMHTSTRLSIDSYNNFADIYLSQAYVKPQGGGALLVNVDQQEAPRAGLLRFAMRFLWPF